MGIGDKELINKLITNQPKDDVDKDVSALKAKLRLAILAVAAMVLGVFSFVIVSYAGDNSDMKRFEVIDKYTVVDRNSKIVYYQEVGKSLVVLYDTEGNPLTLDKYHRGEE